MVGYNWQIGDRSGVKGKVLGLKWRANSQIERGKVARERGAVWGMMARDDQSCFRHSKASWDLSKTAQPLKTTSGNWFVRATKTHLQDQITIKEIQPFSLISVTIFITLKCNYVCVTICWGGHIGRHFIIKLNKLAEYFWQSCTISYLSSFTNHVHLENTYFIYHKHMME